MKVLWSILVLRLTLHDIASLFITFLFLRLAHQFVQIHLWAPLICTYGHIFICINRGSTRTGWSYRGLQRWWRLTVPCGGLQIQADTQVMVNQLDERLWRTWGCDPPPTPKLEVWLQQSAVVGKAPTSGRGPKPEEGTDHPNWCFGQYKILLFLLFLVVQCHALNNFNQINK